MIPAERASDSLAALLRGWWIVALTTIITVGAALGVTLQANKRYDATTKLLVTNSQPADAVLAGSGRSQDPERDLNTGVQLVRLDPTAGLVRSQLHLGMSIPALLSKVTVSLDGNSNVVSIKAGDRDPGRAAAIANAFGQQYLAFRRKAAREQYEQAVRYAQQQLALLETGVAAHSRVTGQLRERIGELQVASTLQTGGVQLVQSAARPIFAAWPRPKPTAAVALLVGLLVGSVIAIAFGRRRR